MTRLRFIAGLLASPFIAKASVKPENKAQRYVITGMFHTKDLNDCTIPPVMTYGRSRVEAVLNWFEMNGSTVWTAEEWESYQKTAGSTFEDGCKKAVDKP